MATAKKSTFLSQHWFLVALLSVLPIGVFSWQQIGFLNQFPIVRTCLVCFVMGLMALPIPFELIRKSLARPWPAVLASLVNMGFIPLAAWLAAQTMSTYIGGGLIVAAAIPCTLASAAVWTRRAGGDDTVAILVTLITNITCVVVTPLWLVVLLGRQVNLQLTPLISELFLVVLMPICVAQLLRRNSSVAKWSESNKALLSTTCQVGILVMVLSGAIEMGRHLNPASTTSNEGASSATAVSVTDIIWTVCMSAVIHLVAMVVGWYSAGGTGVARPQQIGVAIAGSQKTLMIGLKMALDCGVSIIPMVAFHVGQLLIDTFIADRMRRDSEI